MAPLDERQRQKQIVERSKFDAFRKNEARELSDPPVDYEDSPTFGRAARALKPHAEFWGYVRTIGIGVAFVVAALVAGFTWAVNAAAASKFAEFRRLLDPLVLRPSADEIKELRDQSKPLPPTLEDRFNAQTTALAEIKKAVGSPNDPQSDIGKKLDRVNELLIELSKKSPNKTPPPPIGPAAAARGLQ